MKKLNPAKQAETLIKQATKALLKAAPLMAGNSDIELTAEMQSIVEQWTANAIVVKQMRSQLELDATKLVDSVLPLYLEQWFSQKSPPKNPKLVTKRAACFFIVKTAPLTVSLPKKIKKVSEALQLAGLPHQRAKMFWSYVRPEREDDFLTNLPDLRRHKVGQIRSAAESLYQAMLADEQWKILLTKQPFFTVEDPDKFITELPKKAKSAEEMQQVLSVIRPAVYPYQPSHTAPMAALQAKQLWEKKSQRTFYTPDRKYKIVAHQQKVVISIRYGKNWKIVGSSLRKSASDSRLFAQTIAIKPDALADVLSIVKK